ncbi:MAG: hypothetical protein ACR2P0_12220 [Acidimicrobiales bacterium]
MGLIARAIEESGVPTTSVTSAWSITASANPPRAVFTDFPLGHTAGPPGEPDVQLDIARSALAAVHQIAAPGTIVPLRHTWPDGTDWKAEARELRDHRTPRLDAPQYQTDADRDAAIELHGEEAACEVCG